MEEQIPDPVRIGRTWVFPDGTTLPVVSGGAEGDPPNDPPADPPNDPPADPPKKPWGDDADFDPDKAWKLIENLRKEGGSTKAERDELKRKIAEFEDKDKSELERAQGRATTAEKERDESKSMSLRLEIALDKGLTKKQAMRLQGSTREELESDADDMLEELGEVKKTDEPARRPKQKLRGGGTPDEEPDETDPQKLAARIPRR